MEHHIKTLALGWPQSALDAVMAGEIVLGPGFHGGGWAACRGLKAPIIVSKEGQNPFDLLRSVLPEIPEDGGLVGYLGYEAARFLEPVLRLPQDPLGLPVLWAVPFSNLTRLAPEPVTARSVSGLPPAAMIQDYTDRASFVEMVRAVQGAIRRGDIFQANISRRIEASFPKMPDIPSGLFSRMMARGAAAYAAFLPLGHGRHVLSNSPELHVSVSENKLICEPIKGTRPRENSPDRDKKAALSLLQDRKDRAENIMIADLLRNDLSKVCKDGSIKEEAICELRTLPYLHHLYSRISGQLQEGKTVVDALADTFPCGSITGAPKIRAMEIIAAIEGVGRGPYCGSIFLIKADGSAVFSVAIRTGTSIEYEDQTRLRMNFGGGITILSDPQAEYDETVVKSAPFEAMIR